MGAENLSDIVTLMESNVSDLQMKMDQLFMRPRMPYTQGAATTDFLTLDATFRPIWGAVPVPDVSAIVQNNLDIDPDDPDIKLSWDGIPFGDGFELGLGGDADGVYVEIDQTLFNDSVGVSLTNTGAVLNLILGSSTTTPGVGFGIVGTTLGLALEVGGSATTGVDLDIVGGTIEGVGVLQLFVGTSSVGLTTLGVKETTSGIALYVGGSTTSGVAWPELSDLIDTLTLSVNGEFTTTSLGAGYMIGVGVKLTLNTSTTSDTTSYVTT